MIKTKTISSLFLTSVIIIVFVTIPLFEDFLKNKRILDNKREELHMQGQYFNNLRELENNLMNYSSRIEMVNLAISDETVVPSLIRNIEEISQRNGLTFQSLGSFSTQPSNLFPNLKEISIDFNLTGDYSDFKNFIKSIEDSIKIIKFDSISVSREIDQGNIQDNEPSEDLEETEVLFYNVIIKTYYY